MAARQVEKLAQRAAHRVYAHLEGERLIPRFIDSYVMGFDRRQLKNPPEQFRQRSNQLGREALLLLGWLVVEKCGGQFHHFKLGPLRLQDAGAARRFEETFWPALAAQLNRPPSAAAELARLADYYRDPAERQARFSERVAPLLDPLPPMKDKAEHAGRKFFQALDNVAAQVVTRVFARS